MKVVSSIKTLKNRHPDCKVVRRKGRLVCDQQNQPSVSKRDKDNIIVKKRYTSYQPPGLFLVTFSTGKKIRHAIDIESRRTLKA